MAGLYRSIQEDIQGIWTAGWTHDPAVIPVRWRVNDVELDIDPSSFSHFLRNEVDFGAERIIGFGGGRNSATRVQFGSVNIHAFSARDVRSETLLLDYLHDATSIFRSKRIAGSYAGGDLSFIGEGSGFESSITEDGNWYHRGAMLVFEYRFHG